MSPNIRQNFFFSSPASSSASCEIVMAVDSANGSPKVERPAPSPRGAKLTKVSEDELREVARRLANQPVSNSDSGAWGILTAISRLSRKRVQGMHIILTADEHAFGRCVEDTCYRIESLSVSSKHCIICKAKTAADGELVSSQSTSVFIKDTSTNGTYLNWEKLRSGKSKKLQHGDIISFSHPPNHENAYAFVYRDVSKIPCLVNGSAMKRKSEDFYSESKKLKGIGIGAPDGPISLDDVRSLQRSNSVNRARWEKPVGCNLVQYNSTNKISTLSAESQMAEMQQSCMTMELRQQLESHVHTIETLRSENRAMITQHENELKAMKGNVSSSYLDQIKDLRQTVDAKQKEIDEKIASLTESRRSIDDLNERLILSNQSRADADVIIQSQRVTISEIEAQLLDERKMRKDEREKAESDLKSALQRAHLEAEEEIKRQADVHMRQHKEQQEVINKLQESEKENRALVETLRSKVDDARESLVVSEKKVRQLEMQVQNDQVSIANSKKRSEVLEAEVKRLTNELESEKVAREEAWAKVSALELEIASAIRDLSLEKQRFQGARERIILRETQLRAFYSTTEEISSLFTKQQEQLKAMQKTLEDEENYANTLLGIDMNDSVPPSITAAYIKVKDDLKANKDEAQPQTNNTQEASGTSTPKNDGKAPEESSSEGSTTEKHDLDDEHTQDVNCMTSELLAKGTEAVPDAEDLETQCVGEDTVQEDVDPTTLIRTGDLLTSEAPGSWAIETAPSESGENEVPPGKDEGIAADALLMFSEGQGTDSLSNVPCSIGSKMTDEHKALNAMIGIVAPELKKRFMDDDDDATDNENDEDATDNENIGGGDDDDDVMIEDSVG